jgi:hypothetical protein
MTRREPDITVAAGETVFENDLVNIIYVETTIDDVSMDMHFEVTNKTDAEFALWKSDLAIDTQAVGIGVGERNIYPQSTTEDYVILYHSALTDVGFAAENIGTVQITFTINPIGSSDELFQGTALVEVG